MTDRIDAIDAYGDEFALVKGAALVAIESQAEKRGGIAGIRAWDTRGVILTEDGAVEVASFLGNAVSRAAARDLLAELAPRVCDDDLPETVKAFLVEEAPPFLKRTTAQGLAKGSIVRCLIELGRALGRAEGRGSLGTCDACGYHAATVPTGQTGAVSLCVPCIETSARETVAVERAKVVGLVGAARKVVETREARDAAKGKGAFDNAHLDFINALTSLYAELAKLEGGT